MELTLVGLQHAGKTTFVNVIASGSFNEDMIPTVGFNMRKISKGSVTIKLWDIGIVIRSEFVNSQSPDCKSVHVIVNTKKSTTTKIQFYFKRRIDFNHKCGCERRLWKKKFV